MSDQVMVRSKAPSYQSILEKDPGEVPEHLRFENAPADAGPDEIPVEYFTSREQHEAEKAKLWPRVWQLACREDDIPEVGDYEVYNIVDKSVLVVRVEPDKIKAYYNSCLHRGRMLRTECGHAKEIECPFHGFTWNLDGSFNRIPCPWDFPHADTKNLTLPEVRVDTWGGFVYINFDENAPCLQEYLGHMPEHFASYKLEDAYTAVHVQRCISCNWKNAHEAFMEAWHTVITHSQILPFTGDENTQYDIVGKHVSRMLTAMSWASPHMQDVSEQTIMEQVLEGSGRMSADSAKGITLPEGKTAREFVSEMNREAYQEATGMDLSDASHAELQDAILYDVFPNMQVWVGYTGNIVYQFRPAEDDHTKCIFDVRILLKPEPGQEKPQGVSIHYLEDDQSFTEAEELGGLGPVFEQDMGNMPHMMKGLRSSKSGKIIMAKYEELRLRYLYTRIMEYIND